MDFDNHSTESTSAGNHLRRTSTFWQPRKRD
nr:MAG TPA_asm: hypothetical protein [Caudoviricetes sp.]